MVDGVGGGFAWNMETSDGNSGEPGVAQRSCQFSERQLSFASLEDMVSPRVFRHLFLSWVSLVVPLSPLGWGGAETLGYR